MNVLLERPAWARLAWPASVRRLCAVLVMLQACAQSPASYVGVSAASSYDGGSTEAGASADDPARGATLDGAQAPADLDGSVPADAQLVDRDSWAPFGSVPAPNPFYVIGPGAAAIGDPSVDNGERLNLAVGEDDALLLPAGRYDVYAFAFAKGSEQGTVTPFLTKQLAQQPARHQVLWVGAAHESASQRPGADAGVASQLVLTEATRVYAGFYTQAGGRVQYVGGGVTDHDDSFVPFSTASAQASVVTLSEFSSSALTRTYRFSISLTSAGAAPPPPSASTGFASDKPVTLDLRGYELSFHDEFDGPLDVSSAGPGTRWTAHTPYNGDFGDALFSDPVAGDSPFQVSGGILSIRAWYDQTAKHWRSGLLSSIDPRGDGFAQQYGYFEMRAKFPAGPGTWPAFWALDRQSVLAKSDGFEADVVEQYGHAPGILHQVWHLWPKAAEHVAVSRAWAVEDMTAGFHTYGFLWNAEVMIWYFDGKEMWRQPTVPQAKTPLYLMVNLALGSGWPIDKTPDPSFLLVDHVRAYRPLP